MLEEVIKLETPEATFFRRSDENSADWHFGIDCACKSKGSKYSGCHHKQAGIEFERSVGQDEFYRKTFKPHLLVLHTFYMNEDVFLGNLFQDHRLDRQQDPLILVCNDCTREFSFTYESFTVLVERLSS